MTTLIKHVIGHIFKYFDINDLIEYLTSLYVRVYAWQINNDNNSKNKDIFSINAPKQWAIEEDFCNFSYSHALI